ncbi:hypothetical protein P3G55_14965 [Leptospira sp. 96542]|nr:hypothetical protein [Leptospira sp. 96542]
MFTKQQLSFIIFLMSFGFVLLGQKKQNPPVLEMTLHDFMEEYTKPATKLYEKKNNSEYLIKILKQLPSLAPAIEREDWQSIVDVKLANNKPEDTCKSCHTKFKKEYKKNFRKKLIIVPEEFTGFPEEIKSLLK